jgi:hypothetical protein
VRLYKKRMDSLIEVIVNMYRDASKLYSLLKRVQFTSVRRNKFSKSSGPVAIRSSPDIRKGEMGELACR